MYYVAENPTILVGTLIVAALICLIVLKFTQQGKYLVWAIGLGLAAVFFTLLEQVWVTDNERIEAVVYALRDATARSDADAVLALTTPDLKLEPRLPEAGGSWRGRS